MPAVSDKMTGTPSKSRGTSTMSLVVPGIGDTMAACLSAEKKVILLHNLRRKEAATKYIQKGAFSGVRQPNQRYSHPVSQSCALLVLLQVQFNLLRHFLDVLSNLFHDFGNIQINVFPKVNQSCCVRQRGALTRNCKKYLRFAPMNELHSISNSRTR